MQVSSKSVDGMATVKKSRAARKNRAAACITAYHLPTARIAAEAGVDLILIDDSTAVVSQGHESTMGMTLDEVMYHCRAVARGAGKNGSRPLLLGDSPLGSYEIGPEQGRRIPNPQRMLI